MKKQLNGTFRLNEKTAKIKVYINDTDGYISITADVTPYRCRTPHMCGCCHEEIGKAFPRLKKFFPLHLYHTDTFPPMYFYANALHNIANGKVQVAKESLLATDEEMRELVALVEYGLKKSHKWGFVTFDEDAERIFNNECEKMGVRNRYKALMEEFYSLMDKM